MLINCLDNDFLIFDGLFIYIGFNLNLQVGDLVNVQGLVVEYEGMIEIFGFGFIYEVIGIVVLLEIVVFNNIFLGMLVSIVCDLECVEGMCVVFDVMVVVLVLGNDIVVLSIVMDCFFWEVGIIFFGDDDLFVWDGNFELFWIDLDVLN